MLRHVFERVVWAMAMGLVKDEGFAVDASVLEANASRYRGKAPAELDWSEKQRQIRAVAEYLAALDEAAERTQTARCRRCDLTVISMFGVDGGCSSAMGSTI